MNDPSTSSNLSLEEVHALRQRLLELERSHQQCQQHVEQLTQQLAQEKAARQQAEERLHLTLRAAQMVAWDLDLAAHQVVCSSNAAELWGFQAGSGDAFFAVIHPDDRPQVTEAAKRAIAGDMNYFQEYRIIQPDGAIRWVSSRGQVYFDQAGQASRMLGLSVDVTDRKQTEAALREREEQLRVANERFQLAAKAVNCLIYDWHLDSDRIERTDGLTRLLGFSLDEAEPTGRWWCDRIHPEDLQPIRDRATLALQQDDYFASEYRILNKENQYVYVLDQCLVVERNAAGQPTRIVGSTMDIGERKRTESSLRQSEERLRLAMEAAQMGTWDVDLHTGKAIWSEQHFTMLGLTPTPTGEASEEQWISRIHPDDLERVIQAWQQARQERTLYQAEYRVIRADTGEVAWLAGLGNFTYDETGEAIRSIGVLFDISDRKQVEHELRESEQRLQLAQQAGRIGTWEWNLQTNQVSWSEGLWTLLALEPNSITLNLKTFSQFIHPDDREPALSGVEKALAQGDDYYSEFRVMRQDGTVCWLLSKGQVIRTSDGQPERLLGINVDITALKQAEAALAQSNQTLQAIIQACPLAIMGLQADGTVRIWNPAAERIFGWTQEEVLGQFLPAIPDDKRDEFLNNLAITLQGRGLVGVEAQRQKKGNIMFDVELWAAPVDEAQAGISCLSVVADITARKQTEAALHLSEARLHSFVTANIIGILFGDLEGGIQEANDEFLRIVGYTREELQSGKLRWVDITPPEYLPLDAEAIAEARRRGGCTPYEKEYIRKDGSRVPVLVGFGLVLAEREEAVAFILDLSDRKQAEVEREQLLKREQTAREQAEAANRIKDEFLAVLSHELRTPLNPILGWAKLLRTRQFDRQATDRALDTIERNAKLQAQLIEDLLDISRILQGKISLQANPVNLAVVIEAALETVRLSAEAKGIQIQTLLGVEVGLVNGDANRLQQVVWNLLSNAVKFTPAGGCITVQLAVGPLSAQITVTDTGQGISPDFLPYVFEYFRQADSSTTRQFGGLGLGLAIVRHLVELHGGTVQADSAGLGQGATFRVKLPLMVAQTKASSKVQPLEPALDLNQMQVLVVDDDADTREFVAFVLEQAGATVLVAASAAEALDILAQHQLNLLLSDIGMPAMDGYMLIRKVRVLPRDRNGKIPAIALTAFAGEMNQQQALAAGFQMHLAKPIDPEHLISMIATLMMR